MKISFYIFMTLKQEG